MAGWGSSPFGSLPWGAAPYVAPPAGTPQAIRAKDLRHVHVTFDNTVVSAALTPSIYSFIARSVPSFNPTVKSARFLNGRGVTLNSIVELTLENDLSPGVVYDAYIAAFMGVPFTTATFTAYSPNWPANRNFSLWDYIPAINKEEDTSEHLERFILCLQDQLDTTLAAIDNWTDILDLDRAPEVWLNAMMKDLGNPFAFEDLYENEKRLLLRVLVRLYQFKGTNRGIEAAIRFFLGFESQINLFRQSGSQLGNAVTPISLLNDSFVLGGGGPFDFAITVATTDPPGRPLTDQEVSRIKRIVTVVKAAPDRLLEPIFYGLPAPDRVQIAGDSASVTISWSQTTVVPTNWRVYYRRTEPGVSPFNSANYVQVAGNVTSTTIATPIGSDAPGTNYFFVVVPYYGGKEGFRSEIEVRNNLPAPASLVITPGPRRIVVTWPAVPGATSYKVYKRNNTTNTPINSDFVFEVLGGATTFEDTRMRPGDQAFYTVVARTSDSEGFYSTAFSGTAA